MMLDLCLTCLHTGSITIKGLLCQGQGKTQFLIGSNVHHLCLTGRSKCLTSLQFSLQSTSSLSRGYNLGVRMSTDPAPHSVWSCYDIIAVPFTYYMAGPQDYKYWYSGSNRIKEKPL